MAAFKTAFLFLAIVCFLVSCAADEQNHSEVNYKILPVGANLASEFKTKASEKGVRMIYLNLKIGNDSYNPLELQDEILPDRWVWARSNSEPMLSLPYDYDILSLGLLNYQVRSVTVPLIDQPSGCLAVLNSTCQNMVVGRALLDNVTRDHSGEISRETGVVCVAMIEEAVQIYESPIKYHCCGANESMVMGYCGLPVKGSNWFNAFKIFLTCLSVVVFLYCPALLLMLPDCIFNLQDEYDKDDCTDLQDQLTNTDITNHNHNHTRTRNGYEQIQNEEEGRLIDAEIPVDDASPVTCSTLLLGYVQRLPDLGLSFNVKLAVLLFCVLPFVYYVNLGLYLTLKQKYIHECYVKSTVPSNAGFPLTLYFQLSSSGIFICISASAFFMLVLCLRPKDLFIQQELTDNIKICDAMHQHFKIMQGRVFLFTSTLLKRHNSGLKKLTRLSMCCLLKKTNYNGSRIIRALFIFWRLLSTLSTLFLGLIWGAIFLLLLVLVLCYSVLIMSPVFAMLAFLMRKYFEIKDGFRDCQLFCFVVLFCVTFFLLLFTIFFAIVITSCNFIVEMLGFTIMGLVLNVEIVTPYVAFFLVVTTNIYFCYANLQGRYKEVKGFILKYWQQESVQMNKSDQSTIPAKLFWFVCDKKFPVKTEVCLMFRNMAVILTFLFLAIDSIILFGNAYDISTLVSTVAVFISGAIPSLFFKGLTRGKNFTGWEKIKLKREIKMAVKEYLQQSGSNEREERNSVDQ